MKGVDPKRTWPACLCTITQRGTVILIEIKTIGSLVSAPREIAISYSSKRFAATSAPSRLLRISIWEKMIGPCWTFSPKETDVAQTTKSLQNDSYWLTAASACRVCNHLWPKRGFFVHYRPFRSGNEQLAKEQKKMNPHLPKKEKKSKNKINPARFHIRPATNQSANEPYIIH